MILKGNDIYKSDSTISFSSSSEQDIQDSSEEAPPCDGDLLVAQRFLANQLQEQDQSQRENLSHTRCKILKNTCSLIVDSGSCNKFCSTKLVEKLHLTPIAHPKSYKLQWFNEDGPTEVKEQVNISLTIGKYKDEVLCDIIPMMQVFYYLGGLGNMKCKPSMMDSPIRLVLPI
uniref:Uncharacterized protein n=1 Tax=Cajanus cajan TaxID=3821 RepID=A0A151UBU7_CAJCA|nr:hypothetical protein KK1_021039 [Cajanus cajan]